MTSENYIKQTDIDSLNVKSAPNKLEGNSRDNKKIFDKLPEFIAQKHNGLVEFVENKIYTKVQTEDALNKRVFETGSADMCKLVYDPQGEGKVLSAKSAEDALRLGGELPEHYVTDEMLKEVSVVANLALPKATYESYNNLSTVEHFTGKYHLDGRKIYEKTIVVTCGGTRLSTLHGIVSIGDFRTLVADKTFTHQIGTDAFMPAQGCFIGSPEQLKYYSNIIEDITRTHIGAEIKDSPVYVNKFIATITIQYTCTDR